MNRKTDADFLEDVRQAVRRVTGPRELTEQSWLRSDLRIDSIDLVDIAFELESLTGLNVGLRELLLAQENSPRPHDLQVAELIAHLQRLSGARP